MIATSIAAILVCSFAMPLHAQENPPFSCGASGSPAVTAPADAATTPVTTIQDIDLSYLTLQDILAETSIDLATLALENLARSDVAEFAASQIDLAEQDLATLDTWRSTMFPDAQTDLNQSLALVDTVKMELDLPAGQGGVATFGLVSGLSEMCLGDGPFDRIYLASAIDLAQQQRDLAQVAVVAAEDPAIIEFATETIERESAAIGKLVTWQNELVATPTA